MAAQPDREYPRRATAPKVADGGLAMTNRNFSGDKCT
jgi:hypothetical protein